MWLVICLKEDEKVIGFIDLFDFELKYSRVGLGIVIVFEEDRGKGFVSEVINVIMNYCFMYLNVY